MNGQLRSLRELLWRDFRADLLIIVSILLIICGASWGLLRWQLNRVQNLLETQETLQLEIAEAQTALDQLQAQTWGVWLHEDADATRYVVLPMGTLEVKRPPGRRSSSSSAVGRGSAAARRGTGHLARPSR